jgi:hypothetical protein
MSRGRWVYRPNHPQANENGLVPVEIAGPRHEKQGNAAFVISDTMPLTMHMADGRHYDSKSKFRATTRAHGLEEAGTDKSIARDPGFSRIDQGNIHQDVKRAIQELASR